MRTWRKNTGPARVELDRDARRPRRAARARRGRASRRDDVHARLSSRDERESRSGGRPTSGMPSTVWMPTSAPTISNRRGTMSIWTSRSLSERMSSSVSSWIVENATITRSTSSSADELGSSLGRAEQRQVGQVVAALLRARVDEADEVDAVLGVLQQLARDELADLAGADDDRVLEVGDAAPAAARASAAPDRDEQRRRAPRRRPGAGVGGVAEASRATARRRPRRRP